MPNTTKGLPYPASTAPPNVPVDLAALAEALDFTKINLLTSANIPSAASLLSLYPLGVSLLNLAAGDAAAGGWPGAASCHVITIKPTTSRAAQMLFLNSGTSVRAWYRQLVPDPGPHSPWAGGSAPYAQAIGTATLDAATNPTAAVQVNFPTGRFNRAPRVALSSSTPSVYAAVQAVSATAVTLIGRNINTFTSSVTVHWLAAQALDTTTDG